jgi:hypothetical protein
MLNVCARLFTSGCVEGYIFVRCIVKQLQWLCYVERVCPAFWMGVCGTSEYCEWRPHKTALMAVLLLWWTLVPGFHWWVCALMLLWMLLHGCFVVVARWLNACVCSSWFWIISFEAFYGCVVIAVYLDTGSVFHERLRIIVRQFFMASESFSTHNSSNPPDPARYTLLSQPHNSTLSQNKPRHIHIIVSLSFILTTSLSFILTK